MTIKSGKPPAPHTQMPFVEHSRLGEKSFDVVLLQETWACNKISLTGFTGASLAATKQSMTGRPKGGLACLVSTSLEVETVELPPVAP
ncbi:hypothetical protein E2320_013707 [Naja naja]|nr:hypothetical protein E2320_013707 [Naja naja]